MKRTLSLVLTLIMLLSVTSFSVAEEANPWSHLDTARAFP